MLAAIERERPALVWLAFPNNPTGNLFDVAGIERIIRAAPGLVAIDEAYYAFADASFLSRVLEFPNVVVVRTVSKIGMAGLRLGYAVGHPDWIARVRQDSSAVQRQRLTQAAVPLLLAHADAARASRPRRSAASASASMARWRRCPACRRSPTQTNFVLVRVPDAAAWLETLRNAGFSSRTSHGWHPLLADCLRITVGTPAENDALLATLAQAYQAQQSRHAATNVKERA